MSEVIVIIKKEDLIGKTNSFIFATEKTYQPYQYRSLI